MSLVDWFFVAAFLGVLLIGIKIGWSTTILVILVLLIFFSPGSWWNWLPPDDGG